MGSHANVSHPMLHGLVGRESLFLRNKSLFDFWLGFDGSFRAILCWLALLSGFVPFEDGLFGFLGLLSFRHDNQGCFESGLYL